MPSPDLVIIGAGPAGMAAARKAAELGLSVTLLDEQRRAGGQIYRDVDRVAALRADILGQDFTDGRRLTAGLAHGSIQHLSAATVWSIEERFNVSYTIDGQAAQINTPRILLATGALERAMPLPGWTLPGVMTAGAGQILLKQSGVLAQNAVLVGCGPLLYLIAAQMVRAGTPPSALVETQTRRDVMAAMAHWGGALRGWPYLAKGLKLLAEIIRARVPRYVGATDITIEGDGRAEAVGFSHKGQSWRIPCNTVFLHHGVVPNTQAARAMGVEHLWNAGQHSFAPVLDEWGQSNVQGLFIAGDSAGIGGAKAAEHAGALAALKLAEQAGHLNKAERDAQAAPLRRAVAQEKAVRPFLDRAYPPCAEALTPGDDTIICRCEEITAGDIRRYARLGCLGPNQTKAFGRAGMGPCQGRYCGLSVSAILADFHGQSLDATGHYRIRPPLKPVTLGELASMDAALDSAAVKAKEVT